jgi:hypothetical protein
MLKAERQKFATAAAVDQHVSEDLSGEAVDRIAEMFR